MDKPTEPPNEHLKKALDCRGQIISDTSIGVFVAILSS